MDKNLKKKLKYGDWLSEEFETHKGINSDNIAINKGIDDYFCEFYQKTHKVPTDDELAKFIFWGKVGA